MINKEILKQAYKEFKQNKTEFDLMYKYFKGETDAIKNYKLITERTNNKCNTNFIADFIEEEISFSLGNEISYISKSGNDEMIEDVLYNLSHFSESHSSNLLEKMLVHSISYELYYVDKEGQFNSKVVSANEGYACLDDFGNISFFMHFYSKKFDDTQYIDVYTDNEIIHYDSEFNEVADRTSHIFKEVPCGIATYNLDEDVKHKTIYAKIKGLQDAYETNLSDISNEISDFRNAYLMLQGVQIDEEDIPNMKKLGVIQTTDGTASWLIKNINDSFIQNTLQTLEDNMYKLTKHINRNEKMQSNVSGIAMQARLIGLLQKCKLNQKALQDCLKMRLKMLFVYLKVVKNADYDYRDVKSVFTSNLPSDNLLTAQMIAQMGDRLSLETGLSQLSFIENPQNEIAKIKAEQNELMQGENLLEFDLDE